MSEATPNDLSYAMAHKETKTDMQPVQTGTSPAAAPNDSAVPLPAASACQGKTPDDQLNNTTGCSVVQPWVQQLPLAMQGTLMTAVRGPDGAHKLHNIKLLIRCYRRVVLVGAKAVPNDFMAADHFLSRSALGYLTGRTTDIDIYDQLLYLFEHETDSLEHHWLLHFIHSIEIIGYEHPESQVRNFWNAAYRAAVQSFHMNPETKMEMERRLRNRGAF